MTKPVRIQRKRTRGWTKPAGAVCVTRGTLWGNPFVVRPDLEPGAKIGASYFAVVSADEAVLTFREYIAECPDLISAARKNLRGKNLACYCAIEQPCHADVLLEIANSDSKEHNEFPQAKEVVFE